MNSTLRRAIRSFAAPILAGAAAFAPTLAAPAHAAATDTTTCTGTTAVTYTPGLTLTRRNTTAYEDDTAPTCVSSDSTITGTIMHPYSYPIPDAACDDVVAAPGPQGVRWNNGDYSFASSLNFVTTVTAGIVQETGTGTVTAGEFIGDTMAFTWIYPLTNPLQCLTSGGLTGQSGILLIEITGL